MISETKVDGSFQIGNFVIVGYSTSYRSDRNPNGGGILLYIRKDILLYLIATKKGPVKSFYVELNLRNEKHLINCSYNSQKTMISNHLATF